MTGGSAETHLIVVYFFYSPLKNMVGPNPNPNPPRWYYKKTSVPDIGLAVGKGSIASEWAPEDNGRRERAWWTAPMVSVLWKYQKYRVVSDVHIFRRCRSENSDALLYLKLWYSFYIRVEYRRLHENNLARSWISDGVTRTQEIAKVI
jgi:hypothetical protein